MNADNRKIRVLFFEDGIGYGGAAVCLELIVRYLDRNRFYPIVVTSRRDPEYERFKEVCEWRHINRETVRRDKRLVALQRFLRPAGGSAQRAAQLSTSVVDYLLNFSPYFGRLFRFAREKKIDLIHTNNEPVCNMGGVLLAKAMRVPCVSHVRGAVWKSRTSRWLYNQVDHFIAVSDWIKAQVLELGVPEDKIETIWDGRELEDWNLDTADKGVLARFGLREGELAVGMVGRLNPWKGHRVFLQAARRVVERFPGCKLFIVGGAAGVYQEYEAELRSLAAGLNGSVIFTGQVDNVPEVLRALDIVVHASVKPDPYPNVVLEAMLAGKPIIASDLGGPTEMIEHSRTGILIPPGDPEVLAQTICDLLVDSGLRKRLSTEARAVARQRYSIDSHINAIERIYDRKLLREVPVSGDRVSLFKNRSR